MTPPRTRPRGGSTISTAATGPWTTLVKFACNNGPDGDKRAHVDRYDSDQLYFDLVLATNLVGDTTDYSVAPLTSPRYRSTPVGRTWPRIRWPAVPILIVTP